MAAGQRTPALPNGFQELSAEQFFSLGQDDSYYENLNSLGASVRDEILLSLCDVAYDAAILVRARGEEVFGTSLIRYVPLSTVIGQFSRMAHGGARLNSYEFSFTLPRRSEEIEPPTLSFEVDPESNPPTNVHILIGRNGVGKTFALNAMTRCAVDEVSNDFTNGLFSAPGGPFDIKIESFKEIFSSVVSVTFSAFDPFEPVPIRRDQSGGMQYHYIGLKHQTRTEDGKSRPPKDHSELANDFSSSIAVICSNVSMQERWVEAVKLLDTDPLFQRAEVGRLIQTHTTAVLDDFGDAYESVKKEARRLFTELSSGHKIVLLTLTRLVEAVSEKTLVLVDEPEAHLHPPLLSSFIRSISFLLTNRNAVAIIATHSPVILQEVPQCCVWKIRRAGKVTVAERPVLETYGENVGVLTHEIFGLEVTESGFYAAIAAMVRQGQTYDDILSALNGRLGQEGRFIARSLPSADQAA